MADALAAMAAPLEPDDVMRSVVDLFASKKLRAHDIFHKWDTNGDGCLDANEIRSGLADLGWRTTDAEFGIIMARVDKDGGGDVSIKELDRAIKAAEKLPKRAKVEEVVQKKKQGITAEDKEEFRQIFCLFKQLAKKRAPEDSQQQQLAAMDSSGSISVDELEQLLEGVGMKLRPDDIQNMIRDIDKDHSGGVDFEEFCNAMANEIQVDHEPDEIAQCFKAFARKSPEGYIRVEDLRNALTTYMHKDLSLSDVNDLLQHYSDCFVRLPGHDCDFFKYQDYVDLMSPLSERGPAAASGY